MAAHTILPTTPNLPDTKNRLPLEGEPDRRLTIVAAGKRAHRDVRAGTKLHGRLLETNQTPIKNPLILGVDKRAIISGK